MATLRELLLTSVEAHRAIGLFQIAIHKYKSVIIISFNQIRLNKDVITHRHRSALYWYRQLLNHQKLNTVRAEQYEGQLIII